MHQFDELKMTKQLYTTHEWKSLRDLNNAFKECIEKRAHKLSAVNEAIQASENFNSSYSEFQSKQIRIRILQQQIKEAKGRIQSASNRMVCLEEVIENKKKEEETLENDVIESNTQAKNAVEETEPFRFNYIKQKNELIFRRRFMLFELYSIYFTEKSSGKRRERNCSCSKFDVIQGLHLPSCADRNGHNEIEMTAALGHLTNILIVIGRILNYNFHSPMFFKSSKSFILERNTHQIYHLFDCFSRSHRERFVHAYLLLNRNIVQLRHDLGLTTLDVDRPIQNLQDALLCAFGKASCTQILRCSSIHSPSLIIPDIQKSPQNGNTLSSLKNILKLRTQDDNILDVVSSKNERFDVQQLCSRSVT